MVREAYDLEAAMAEFGSESEELVFQDGPAPIQEPEPRQEPEQDPENLEPEPPAAEINDDDGDDDRPRYATQEDFQSLRNSNELYMQQIRQLMESRSAQPHQAPSQPREQEMVQAPKKMELVDEYGNTYEDPLFKEHEALKKEVEELRAAHQKLSSGYATANAMQMRREAFNALQEIRTEFPDFDEFVPEARIQMALQNAEAQARQTGQWGYDWKAAYKIAYAPAAIDKYRAQKDELAQAREEKRVKQAQAASTVPTQGSSYQAPRKIEHNSFERGYDSVNKAFAQELEALGG